MPQQPLVFISYSQEDEVEKNALLSHLHVLQQARLIDVWSDDRIRAGTNWQWEINQAMAQAQIAILLITANYLASDFMKQQIYTLLQRRTQEGLVVFPLIAKDCAWDAVDWLRVMSVRPQNHRPIWGDGGIHVDKDLATVAREIATTMDTMQRPELQRLRNEKMRRLDFLKQRVSQFGKNVPSELINEMEGLRNQIGEFQVQIDQLQAQLDATDPPEPSGCLPVWAWATLGVIIVLGVIALGVIGVIGGGLGGTYLVSLLRATTTPSLINTRVSTLPTFTSTPSPTPLPIAQPPPTITPTPVPPTPIPTPTPYYVEIVIDASERMSKEFDTGITKMQSAWQTAATIARTRIQQGQFVSFRLFGGAGGVGSCVTTQSSLDFTDDSQQVVDYLAKAPSPGGDAAAVTALLDASDQLQSIENIGREIILLTGGDDGCGSTLSAFYNSDNQSLWTQTFVVLFNDEDFGPFIDLETRGANINHDLVKNRAEAETVAVAIANHPPPATPTPTPTIVTIAAATATNPPTATSESGPTTVPPATSIAIRPTNTVAAVPPQTPTSSPTVPSPTPIPTLTNTPTSTFTPTPTKTFTPPPTATLTPTPTKTFIPTSTSTRTPTPTPTATQIPTATPTSTPLPANTTALPPQNDVYMQGCPLISETTGYNAVVAGQAAISANLVANGHTGQSLKLDFSVGPLPNYTGWEVVLGNSDGIDLSSYTSLVFYVRGEAGGEEPNVWLMTDYGGGNFERFYQDVGVTTSWQQVVIPLENFTKGTMPSEDVNLAHINKIQIVFEWYDGPRAGIIYLDDLCVQ